MAAKRLNVNPNKCVVIEDNNIGLMAAKSAGIKCVIAKSYYCDNEDFTAADLVTKDLSDSGVTTKKLKTLIE